MRKGNILIIDDDFVFFEKIKNEFFHVIPFHFLFLKTSELKIQKINGIAPKLIIVGISSQTLHWRFIFLDKITIPLIVLSKYFTREVFQKMSEIPSLINFLKRESRGLELQQAIQLSIKSKQIFEENKSAPKYWFFKIESKNERINLESISWFYTSGRYTKLFLSNGSYKLAHISLSNLEQQLGTSYFIRISRNCMINPNKVTATNRSGSFLYIGENKLAVSNSLRSAVLNRLGWSIV